MGWIDFESIIVKWKEPDTKGHTVYGDTGFLKAPDNHDVQWSLQTTALYRIKFQSIKDGCPGLGW